ncbi:MAG: TonB-dependent receptor [Parabacteroides sp.]|nr:TonB-dependent receptor [Parabacteroides sp.]
MQRFSAGKPLTIFLLTVALFLFSIPGWSQKIITGRITDSQNNEPLAGATVHIEGTIHGDAADADGYFELKVPEQYASAVLVFRSIGYYEAEKKYDFTSGRDLGVIALSPSSIGLNEIKVLASFVNKEGDKPLVVSTISAADIETKLGNQEFPEILKSVPSVYTTRQGGGMGDARINLRGFGSENIGLLINGIPVNGMENGAVYWSNWAGLADVTQSIQVQRGLGASKLGIPSVGGTINIVTKSIDAEAGGSVYYGVGNDGYQKLGFNVSSGLMKNGWAFTLAGSHTKGDGYVRGTNFEGWSYFVNLSKRLGEAHLLSFTAFGAPQ